MFVQSRSWHHSQMARCPAYGSQIPEKSRNASNMRLRFEAASACTRSTSLHWPWCSRMPWLRPRYAGRDNQPWKLAKNISAITRIDNFLWSSSLKSEMKCSTPTWSAPSSYSSFSWLPRPSCPFPGEAPNIQISAFITSFFSCFLRSSGHEKKKNVSLKLIFVATN